MTLSVQVEGRTLSLPFQAGQTVLEVLQTCPELGFNAPCGGKGLCGKCRVLLKSGDSVQEVLACRHPAKDGEVVYPGGAEELTVEQNGENASCITPDGESGYGIACDIGTTTVVCLLSELATGRSLAVQGSGNAQRSYGADVISRIVAAGNGQREALRLAVTGQLREMIRDLCASADIPLSSLRRVTCAGNPTMCHLLTGLDPASLGQAPFTPVSRFGETISPDDISLPFGEEVYILPSVSGYVGGDITADLLAVGLDRAEKPALLIDVGTNGEMAIGCGDRFICCSTAAGPAFEGAQISCGMTAGPGAVRSVEFRDGALHCEVIGGGEAAGLCGSGLIDAVAVMLELGVLEDTGRMLDPEEDEEDLPEEALPYLFLQEDDTPAFRLCGEIYVTQADIRKLQLGKAAIAAGQQVLLNALGVDYDEVGALLLAGGFGSYIRPESAARIGLIPEELLPVTRAVGNTALEGARCALLSAEARRRLSALQEHMEYLELSGNKAFNDAYIDAMMFPGE